MLIPFASAVAYAILVRNHLKTPYDPLFDLHGARFGVDSNVLRAIGRHESGFRNIASPKNVNGTRDFGIMQINETNFRTLGLNEQSALIPEKNIEAGAKFLMLLKKELGAKDSLFARISAYNIGSPTVIRRGIVNDAYVASVYWHFSLYQMGRVFA